MMHQFPKITQLKGDYYMTDFLKKTERRYKAAFICALVCGLLAHGMALFNKYCINDDLMLFSPGATYSSGRWMLGIIARIESFFFGDGTVSLPLFNGILSIIFIALAAAIVVRIIDIKSTALAALIGAIFVVFPTVTSMFGYMFTAHYYMFAMLLSVLGTALVCCCGKWYFRLAGVVIMGCSIGIYQAFIPIMLSLLLLYFMTRLVADDSPKARDIVRLVITLALSAALFMAIYIVANKVFLALTHNSLTDYQGIIEMGQAPIGEYLTRIGYAYTEFFSPTASRFFSVHPNTILTAYRLTLAVSAILALALAVRLIREKKIACAVLFVLSVALIPLGTNFIFVMVDPELVHSLMVYAQVIPFIFLAWLCDNTKISVKNVGRSVTAVTCALLAAVGLMYARYDNKCYLRAELLQQETIGYFTTLVTRIESTEGFTDELPVVYINAFEKTSENLSQIWQLNDACILPYQNLGDYINNYAWVRFMEVWCGFSPATAEGQDFENLPEVEAMPSYPDDGSIKVINGAVVVKF